MGYSPWGHKESDTTEQLTHIVNSGLWLHRRFIWALYFSVSFFHDKIYV